MKKLSIITINYNDAAGLKKTMESVLSQTEQNFEYIVVDGGSTDGSVEVVSNFKFQISNFKWISEKDNGIYNAMNKGLRMATGIYVQFLNSGDTLVNANITAAVLPLLNDKNAPSILYGVERHIYPDGRIKKSKELPLTLLTFYRGTIPHSAAYIKRDLFEEYGYYDENLKIVSDWKWYIQAIVLGGEEIQFIPIEITNFDKQGISSTNKQLDKKERQKVLQELIPMRIFADYQQWSSSISQIERINRYKLLDKIFYFVERCLFKIEKWNANRN